MKKDIAFLMILMLLTTISCQGRNTTTTAPAVSEATTAPVGSNGEYAFTFSAQTLDGKEVTEAFFGQHDLTMVNVWASWCGSCRGELGELGQLYQELPANVGFLSVTIDDPADLADAKALLEQNSCAFPCLDGQASAGLTENVINKVMAIPTTLFFDRNGNQVGEWIVGVPQGSGSVSDAYMAEIQVRLDLLNVK
jgi:thiol-disulfide isomerase/thioredoxin